MRVFFLLCCGTLGLSPIVPRMIVRNSLYVNALRICRSWLPCLWNNPRTGFLSLVRGHVWARMVSVGLRILGYFRSLFFIRRLPWLAPRLLGFTGHRCRLSTSPAPSPGLLDAGNRSLAQASSPRSVLFDASFWFRF